MINIPDGWELRTLNYLCDDFIVPMRDKPKEFNGNVPWCKIEDFNGKYLSTSQNNQFVNENTIRKMNLKVNPVDTVLCSCSAVLGVTAIVKKPLITNQTFIGIVPNSKKLDSQLLYYILPTHIKQFENISSGTTIVYISRDKFEKLEILLPKEKKEQEQIAEILSEVDSAINKAEAYYEKNRKIKTALMQDLLTHGIDEKGKIRNPKTHQYKDSSLGDIPMEWDSKELSQISFLTSSKRVFLSEYKSAGIPFYRGKEISELQNKQQVSDMLYISEEKYNEIKKNYGAPKLNDILITAVGTLGNIMRVSNNDKFYFKDGNLIWLQNINIDAFFLEYLLRFIKNSILDNAIGSSQKALTIKSLKNMQVIFPQDTSEQQKIAQILLSQDEKIEKSKAKLEKLKSLKTALMQDLLSGTKRVNHL